MAYSKQAHLHLAGFRDLMRDEIAQRLVCLCSNTAVVNFVVNLSSASPLISLSDQKCERKVLKRQPKFEMGFSDHKQTPSEKGYFKKKFQNPLRKLYRHWPKKGVPRDQRKRSRTRFLVGRQRGESKMRLAQFLFVRKLDQSNFWGPPTVA